MSLYEEVPKPKGYVKDEPLRREVSSNIYPEVLAVCDELIRLSHRVSIIEGTLINGRRLDKNISNNIFDTIQDMSAANAALDSAKDNLARCERRLWIYLHKNNILNAPPHSKSILAPGNSILTEIQEGDYKGCFQEVTAEEIEAKTQEIAARNQERRSRQHGN